MFKVEPIPDDAFVFRRVSMHCWDKVTDGPLPGAFEDREEDEQKQSVDWNKYSTIKETAERVRPDPSYTGGQHLFGAVALRVSFLRKPHKRKSERGLEVKHQPRDENRAHSLIIGRKGLKLMRMMAREATQNRARLVRPRRVTALTD